MKKGFTLVELLAVIVILSIISIIIFPNVVKIINDSKLKLFQSQLLELEQTTKNFVLENPELLDINHLNNIYISIESLKKSGYLNDEKIKNPNTSREMNGCMKIVYNNDTNQYNIEYLDNECNEDGYIITYENGSFNKLEKNSKKPAYDTIINNNQILSLGDSIDGLYNIEEEYIYRGENPSNYAKIGNDKYRIISLNKNDKTIKLIKEIPETGIFSTDNSNSFVDSKISQINFPEFISSKTYSNKIVDSYKWPNGKIDISLNMNYDVLKSVEKTSYVQNRLGLINISDYAIASLNKNCYLNVNSVNCNNQNYLYNLFKTSSLWTMNNSETGKIITLENGIITDHTLNSSIDSSYRIYPIVILKKNITVTGVGTSSSPYIIK